MNKNMMKLLAAGVAAWFVFIRRDETNLTLFEKWQGKAT